MGLDFSDLRTQNVRRCEESFFPLLSWSWTDWATAMGGECGEALNLIKKRRRGDTFVSTEDIGRELADMICYADLLAARLEIDLGQAVTDKFNEVSERVKSDVRL